MFSFLNYSLESALCLAVLLLPYLVWIRKMTFHQWNRFFLLGAIFFSLSAPLINIEIKTASTLEIVKLKEDFQLFEETLNIQPTIKTENIPSQGDNITAYKQPEIAIPNPKSNFSFWGKINPWLTVYSLGFSVFLGMFLFRLTKLFKLIVKSNKTLERGFTSIHLQGKQTFSFFHFVFFDHNRYNDYEKQILIKHEKIHIQQWHSLDLLCLEILQILFWFNPLYHFYKKLLQQEHEYFVDTITSKDVGQPQYAQMLFSLATQRPPLVGHAFAYIPIKHRIFKLFQKPSTPMEKSRFFVVLPVMLSLFLVFSCSFDELEEMTSNATSLGNNVSNVQAYFVDERAVLKQETFVGSMELNEDGTIVDLEMKEHPLFGNNVPSNIRNSTSSYFPSYFFKMITKVSNQPENFFARNSQWLFAGDIDIKESYLETILYATYAKSLLESKKQILSQEDGFDITNISNKDENIIFFTGEKFRDTKPFTSRQAIIRELEITPEGQLLFWKEIDEINHVWGNQKAKDILLDSILRKNVARIQKVNKSIELKYSSHGFLQELVSNFSMDTEFNGEKRGPNLFEEDILQFVNDEQGRVKEVHILRDRNTVLRKYRFHYNEAGYCTKKECINREGNVEFSVRFEYDFFE